jgi:hypothetical protein
MKKIIIFLIFSLVLQGLISQEIKVKVIEKRGIVDLKKNGEWISVNNGEILEPGTEIFTGIYAQLTLEIGTGSYITINQLSHSVLGETKTNNADLITEMYLLNGYLVLYAKKNESYKNKILINFIQGNTIFQEAGGEVYLRKEQGVIIKSFSGFVSVNPKSKTFYFIKKDEMCGITPDGILIENDYFLRRAINIKPYTVNNQSQVEAYYNFIFQPYSSEMNSNDYRDALSP